MHYGNYAQDEPEITGDMPSESCSVLAFPQEKSPALVRPFPTRESIGEGSIQEDEEPTTVEPLKRGPKVSWFYHFLFSPHYKTVFSLQLHRYCLRVRSRVRQSRERHLLLYPDSGFQKLRRLWERAVLHAKKNLAVH